MGYLVVFMALLLSVATFAPALPSGANMRASIDRPVDSDAVSDPSGTLGLTTGSLVCEDGLYEMVSVTNSYGISVDVTVQLANDSGDVADLYFNGSFVSDSVTFSLGPGESRSVDAFASCAAEPSISYDVEAVGPGINTDADGRVVTVTGLDQDWPQFSFDERNSGSPATHTGPTTPVTEKWTYTAGGAIRTAPAVTDDTAYVGSQDGNLHAVDAHTGEVVWTFDAGSEVKGSPAIDGGTIYVGTKNGEVYAVDATSGTAAWASPATDPADEVIYPLTVANDTVFASVKKDKLYAFDASNGSLKWSFTQDGGEPTGVAVSGDTVYLADDGGNVHALNVSDGGEQWQNTDGAKYTSAPAFEAGTLFVGDNNGKRVRAIDAENGTQEWAFTTSGAVTDSPTVEGDTVFAGDDNGNVYAIQRSDGTQLWTNSTAGGVITPPVVVNGTVYVGDANSNLAAYDADTGTELFETGIGFVPVEGLAVSENVVFAGDGTDTLYALHDGLSLRKFYDEDWPQFQYDAENTGWSTANVGPIGGLSEKWRFQGAGVVSGGPTVADGIVYVGTENGNVYARYERNNTEKWTASPGGVIKEAPTVGEENLYVAHDDGTLRAMWRSNGTTRWTHAVGDTMFGSPTVRGETVYVGGKNREVYALWSNGTVRWSNTTGVSGEIRATMTATADTVYATDKSGWVYAWDRSTGDAVWTVSLGGTEILGAPVAANDRIYVATRNTKTLHALYPSNGTTDWTYDVAQEVRRAIAVTDDTVVVSDNGGTIHGVWAHNGTGRWTNTTIGGITQVPGVVDGLVYVANDGGTLSVLVASNGSTLATYALDAGAGESLAVANDQIYVGDANGILYSVEGTLNDEPTASFTHSPSKPAADEPVSFDATGSSDSDGSIEKFEWDWDGDGVFEATGETVNHSFDWGGAHDVTLRVTDDLGATGSMTSTIVVGNDEPIADFDVTPAQPDKDIEAVFNGSLSVDGDGTIVSYEWDWTTDGTYDATGETANHTFTARGDYNVTLRVTDDDGAINTTTKTVTVKNTAPTASFDFSPTEPYVGQSTDFDASASTDVDGSITTYEWDWESDGTYDATGETATHAFGSGGNHTVTLRVTDDDGATNTTNRTIHVRENWPQYSFDAANTGETGNSGPTATMQAKWSPTIASDSILGGPVVHEEVVYVGSKDQFLYARHETNGSAKWSFDALASIEGTPTVDDDTVYVGTGANTLYGVWQANGSKRWEYALDGAVVGSPTVSNGTVYVGTNAGTMYAVWADNGTERWNYSAGATVIRSTPAVENGSVYFGTEAGALYALDVASGTPDWSVSTTGAVLDSPTVGGDTVYVAAGTKGTTLHAINVSDGSFRWNGSTTIAGDSVNAPSIDGDTVYVGGGGKEGTTLHAYHRTNGTERWTYSSGPVGTPSAVVGGYVYGATGDKDGKTVFIVDASTGSEVATYDLVGAAGSSLAVANGNVYVGDDGGALYALEAA